MSNGPTALFTVIRRYPYGVACVVATILLGVGAWFLRGQIEELKIARQERAREGEAMLALLVSGSIQRQELATVREVSRRIQENLLEETNLAENTWYFFKLEELTGVRLPELHPLNSPLDKSPLYRRIPFTLRAVGTHAQVASFLRSLETGPRLVSITSFAISKADSTGTTLSLDLSLELLGRK